MIKFAGFMSVSEPGLTKVKLNMRASADGMQAWDLLLADDPKGWLDMNRYRTAQPSKSMGRCKYVLSFAQCYRMDLSTSSSAASSRWARSSLRSSMTPDTN